MLRWMISQEEQKILHEIEDVGYGEIYEIETVPQKPTLSVEISEREQSFLKAIRTEKRFDKLIVHDSEPAMAEYASTTILGRKCLRKLKF